MYKNLLLDNLKAADNSKDLGVGGKITLEWILESGEVWTGFICIRIGTSGGLL